MSDRPDWIKCIRHAHTDMAGKSWCGRIVHQEFVFDSIDHAACNRYNWRDRGRLVACLDCVEAVMSLLRQDAEIADRYRRDYGGGA